VLLNQCPHQLDLWQWICGMPKKVYAHMHFGLWHDIEVEDDVTAYVEYENGATGVFVTTTGDAHGTNRFEIQMDRARLIAENGKPFHEYLIGSSTARPLKEFLLEMKQSIAPDLDFVFGDIPFTGIDLPLSRFDCGQTERDTGFRAEISFAEGCRRTCEWWKEVLKEEIK